MFAESLNLDPELENSQGQTRQIDRPTTLVSCPLRADRYRNSALQRIDAECQQETHAPQQI